LFKNYDFKIRAGSNTNINVPENKNKAGLVIRSIHDAKGNLNPD
jgi:hypothetical protein